MATTRMTAHVHGTVQGVGFRYWTKTQAKKLGVTGYAKNLADGRVEVVAEGEEEGVDKLAALLREDPSSADRPGSVTHVATQYGEPKGAQGFEER